jgi:hypothetical protein
LNGTSNFRSPKFALVESVAAALTTVEVKTAHLPLDRPCRRDSDAR